jgi:hypothetical protein
VGEFNEGKLCTLQLLNAFRVLFGPWEEGAGGAKLSISPKIRGNKTPQIAENQAKSLHSQSPWYHWL